MNANGSLLLYLGWYVPSKYVLSHLLNQKRDPRNIWGGIYALPGTVFMSRDTRAHTCGTQCARWF